MKKKLIKISTILAVSATILISCSSDSEYGMLEAILNSQEKASYTISKSSFVYGEDLENSYFVSVEDDGIYKASYTPDEDNADSNILDNVKRELYEGTDDLTQILSISTDATNETSNSPDKNISYVVYVSEDNETHLASFDNTEPSSSSLAPIDIDNMYGTFKNLTSNGYIITTDVDTSTDKASLYIYSLADVAGGTYDADDYLVQLSNIFSEYGEDDDNGSSRYLDYCVYYKTENSDVSNTANATADGLIISLTDSDDDKYDYIASDRYYYFSGKDLGDQLSFASGSSTSSSYKINIDADDDDAVNAAVVAAYGDASGENAMIITSDGNCYATSTTDTSLTDNTLKEICKVEDSDTFAVHLPSLFFNDSVYTQDTSADTKDYLIGMTRDDYIYVYYYDIDNDDARYSTYSDITVDYTDELNNSSDIIYYAKISSDSDGVETYWVATADNGYYTIKIDTKNIIDDSDSHFSEEGFSY